MTEAWKGRRPTSLPVFVSCAQAPLPAMLRKPGGQRGFRDLLLVLLTGVSCLPLHSLHPLGPSSADSSVPDLDFRPCIQDQATFCKEEVRTSSLFMRQSGCQALAGL